MKKLILGILFCSQSLFSGELGFEVKAPFVELEERMEMELSAEFVDSLRPFARNLGRRLDSLLERASELDKKDAEEYLVSAVTQLVYQGDIKVDEMLSREVLERAILIHRVLVEETNDEDFGVVDMRIRLITRAIEMARDKYADQDINFFDTKSELSFATFGKEYIVYLAELNKSVFDASAQYQLQKLALKFYQYDLARDVNFESHATDIVEIFDSLPSFPESTDSDRSSIQYIRSLRNLMSTLDVVFPENEIKDLTFENTSKIQIGKSVLHGNSVRKVEGLDDNGRVVLEYRQYYFSQTFTTRNEVDLVVEEFQGYRAGDEVLYGDSIREIQYVTENGRVVLAYKQYYYSQDFTDVNSISKLNR